MTFGEAIASGFQKYATFSGRAVRSEYWWWTLFVFLVSLAAAAIDYAIFPLNEINPVHTIVSIALFIPGLAVTARRLHDIDRTAWWILIALTGIGIILLIIWACFRGTEGPNRFGPDPLAGTL